MDIWFPSIEATFSAFLKSTSHQYYFNELVQETGLARGTLSSNLKRLKDAGFIQSYKQNHNHESRRGRPYHVYYSLTPRGVSFVRLMKE